MVEVAENPDRELRIPAPNEGENNWQPVGESNPSFQVENLAS